MNELKKIAKECWSLADEFGYSINADRLRKAAAALDALAAQSQEPVTWFRWTDMDGYERITSGRPSVEHVHPDSAVVPFTPQPASAQKPAVPEEFAKALDLLMHHVAEMAHENAYRRSADARAVTDKHGPKVAEVHAAVLRLYALAGAAVKVPDGWKLVPAKPTDTMLVEGSLAAIGRASLHTCGEFGRAWSAMLNAAPEAGS